MSLETNHSNFIYYMRSRLHNAQILHRNFVLPLERLNNVDAILEIRRKCLDFVIEKLDHIIAEVSFNLFHVSLSLQEDIKKSQLAKDFETFEAMGYEYMFYTCLYLATKFCGDCIEYKKIKEMIIESNLDYNTVLLCEMLFLNYLNWNVLFVSPTENIYSVLNYLGVEVNKQESLMKIAENYIEYVFSEYELYASYDQFTVSLAICRLVLSTDITYIINFDSFLHEAKLDHLNSDIAECAELISSFLNLPDWDLERASQVTQDDTMSNISNDPLISYQ